MDIFIDVLFKIICLNREVYYLKFKVVLFENLGILNIFKKKELLILGKFYNIKLK